MTFHLKGFLVFAAFCAVVALATDPAAGAIAVGAGLVIEALLWRGIFGAWRGAQR